MSSENRVEPEWVQEKRRRRNGMGLESIAVGEVREIGPDRTQAGSYEIFKRQVSNAGRKLGRVFFSRQREDGVYEVYRDR